MQVSWIDPEEIARLTAQLEGPLEREEPTSWNLDTLPDISSQFTLEESSDEASSNADSDELADAIAAPVPEHMEQQGATPAPELEHIREKLRAIRSSAQDAGLLPVAKPASGGQEINTPVPIAPARTPVRIPPAPSPPSTLAVSDLPSPISHLPNSTPLLPPGGTLTERLQIFMPWVQSVAPCEDILLVDDHGDLLWGGPSRADLALSVVLASGAGLQSGSEALTRSSVFIRSRLGEQKELSVLPCPTRYGMVTLALLNATGLSNEIVTSLREALKLCIDGSV
ncbi:MAG: hypothetical protein K8R87_07550 [Verrucomicrobia bacterium]|nr:hypothetical protein [Verrucomicrobiota bacterium]